MGDQYFNVSLRNDGTTPIRFESTETSFEPFLRDPRAYEVGVKRFKIPLREIDVMRVYVGECLIGFNYDRSFYMGAAAYGPLSDP